MIQIADIFYIVHAIHGIASNIHATTELLQTIEPVLREITRCGIGPEKCNINIHKTKKR